MQYNGVEKEKQRGIAGFKVEPQLSSLSHLDSIKDFGGKRSKMRQINGRHQNRPSVFEET